MITVFSRKRASSLALAIALATGGAVVATAVFPTEASAQRRERDRDRDKQEAPAGGGYGDAFRAAYVPLDEKLKVEGGDISGIRPELQALAGTLTTQDEKLAGGSLIFNAAVRLEEPTLQLQGMELMLESGMLPAEQIGRYNFIAYQLSNNMGQFAKSRRYLQAAIDNNFTTDQIDRASLEITMAESFFAENNFAQGFEYLMESIESRKSQGIAIDEQWYRRGITVAYENQVTPTVYEIASMWLADYPSESNWRDSINIARNLNSFQPAEMLDLFRLSRSTGALQEPSDYDYYVEAADARRLPKEVKEVIEEGLAAGDIAQSNLYLTEALEIANGRIASDRADLPALERDAMAASAGLRTVVAAGSAFLSYGEYAKSAQFYERALGMPGVDTNEALTRLGIAQVGMGNYAAARETFGKVTGTRTPIAGLWSSYAAQLAGGSASSASAQPEAAVADATS